MWVHARYLPVSFFSLRPANATSSGGKTLLVPTPFAVKMALLTVLIRLYGIEEGERLFPHLCDLSLYARLPDEIVVVKSFSKIRRELKDKSNKEKAQRAREEKAYPMQPTIAYREYVNYKGTLELVCEVAQDNPLCILLPELLTHINYFGKRGGFFQIVEEPVLYDEFSTEEYVHLTASQLNEFHAHGTLQMLDDCGPGLNFAKANIYDEAKIVMHKDRILRHIVLPYMQLRSSRSYSWYQRLAH